MAISEPVESRSRLRRIAAMKGEPAPEFGVSALGSLVNDIVVGLAVQIAYEYPDWGEEHVSDMLRTYPVGKRPCSGDVLMDLTVKADELKKQGKTYSEAEAELVETLREERR